MKRRIYTDTSVIGGCLDEEFEEFSRHLLQRFLTGEDVLVLSDLTRLELIRAPEEVRNVLAEAYISGQVIGAAKRLDAQHIATATVSRVDVLVSWNFKHIVNLERIHGYNSINLRLGYPLLEIRTPREVVSYENKG